MLRRVPLLAVALACVAVALIVVIARELSTTPRVHLPRTSPSASVATPATPPVAPAPPTPPANYTMVAARNLFSPTRSEAPPAPPTPPPAPPPLPKPNLFGVVLIEGTPVAYLEDPVTKRVARYRVGDNVAGGTVKAIDSDTVTLNRPDGAVAVRLHDPARPRPAAPASAPNAAPNAPGYPPVNPSPTPGVPGGIMPEGRPSAMPVRRPPIPSVLGRVPQQPTDAAHPQ
jgi:hypothetical protein